MEATGLVVSFVSGYETPAVEEKDTGATDGKMFVIKQYFEADIVHLDNVFAAAHRGT
jgi:hypothetical protein